MGFQICMQIIMLMGSHLLRDCGVGEVGETGQRERERRIMGKVRTRFCVICRHVDSTYRKVEMNLPMAQHGLNQPL